MKTRKKMNQALIDTTITQCDTLGVGMIERDIALRNERKEILSNPETVQKTMDYIFGHGENPLIDITYAINENMEGYKARCESLTQMVLKSK